MRPDVAKKRGTESKNYSPSIPPTIIPFLLIPDLFYVRFLGFSFFHFLTSFLSFLDPIWTPLDPTMTCGLFAVLSIAKAKDFDTQELANVAWAWDVTSEEAPRCQQTS